ncbi:MAG TPA: hypothetical protein VFG87_05315 [Amycolatopsis sp.]|nr:hypothetical protein [Amycolatopsis sp.]
MGPGLKWGYGLMLNAVSLPGMRAAGTGSWAGLANTFFRVDPASGLTGAIYSPSLPFVPPEQLKLYIDFELALYATG